MFQCERKGDVRKWWSVKSIGKDVEKSRDNRVKSIREKEMEITRE